MNLYFFRPAAAGICAVLVGALTACGGSVAGEPVSGGPGLSDLAPTYDVEPRSPKPRGTAARTGRERQAQGPATRRERAGAGEAVGERTGRQRARQPARPSSHPAGTTAAPPRRATGTPRPRPADPGPVTITDPVGDMSAGLEGRSASADIVAVQVDVTGDTVEVRTTFAADVPERMTDGRGMNVASFYDVDGNGLVDYEVWVSLVEDGWGTGYRDARERTAAFGPSTGIDVAVAGRTLTTTFPLDRIAGAQRFRWSAASEWGSYESMAASTSARDHAPGDGAAAYPG